MKKIAVLTSNKSIIFESLNKFFKDINYPVEIKLVSTNFSCDNYVAKENLTEYFQVENFDIVVVDCYEDYLDDRLLDSGKFLKIQYSLLPAFEGNNEIARAYSSGVKVSGITIYYPNSDIEKLKIVAQYPVLIKNNDHFDDFKSNICELAKVMSPYVIKSVLEDTVFDYSDMFSHKDKCSGECSGCKSSCNKPLS